jgi:endo-1,3(4)-beta-glucanase
VVSAGSVTGDIVDLPSGATATWFPVPADGEPARLADLAQTPVTGGAMDYSVEPDTVTTRLTYQAEDDTAFAAMPHQQAGLHGSDCGLGSYPSIYGTLQLCAGRSLAWTWIG